MPLKISLDTVLPIEGQDAAPLNSEQAQTLLLRSLNKPLDQTHPPETRITILQLEEQRPQITKLDKMRWHGNIFRRRNKIKPQN